MICLWATFQNILQYHRVAIEIKYVISTKNTTVEDIKMKQT